MSEGMVLVEIQLECSLGHGNTPVVEIYFKQELPISIKTTTYRYYTSQWLAIVIARSIAKVVAPMCEGTVLDQPVFKTGWNSKTVPCSKQDKLQGFTHTSY